MSLRSRGLLGGLLAIVLSTVCGIPSLLEGQTRPPTRVVVSVDPPWPGVEVEAVGLGVSGQTGLEGRVTLAVRAQTVEFRGTTPDGEVVSRIVDLERWTDEITLHFPGLRAAGAAVTVRTPEGTTVTVEDHPPVVVDASGEVTLRGLVPGRHVLRARDPATGRTVSRTVTVGPGPPTLLDLPSAAWVSSEPVPPGGTDPAEEEYLPFLAFPAGSGLLELTVSEAVEVLLHDALLGPADSETPLRTLLSVGSTELQLLHPSGETRSLMVDVPEGDLLELFVEWRTDPAPGSRLPWMDASPALALGFGVAVSLTLGLTTTALRRRRAASSGSVGDGPNVEEIRALSELEELGREVDGVTFETYTLRRYLGRGGMAAVYGAQNAQGEMCALKILEGSARSDPDLRLRFFREARVLEKIALAHPDAPVVRVFRHGTAWGAPGGSPFIELELIVGRSLLECVSGSGPPPTPVAIHILSEVAKALRAAHDCGVLHRDLTPDNILIENEHAAAPVVRVIDFGVAKHELTEAHTVDGSVFGKPPYMAPEVWQHADLDARTDLYALGMIGYLLLTGSTPFSDPNPLVVMRMHEDGALPVLPPEVPHDLRRIVKRLVEKAPEDRYPDAGALLDDLASLTP